jgi:hypothetical protein
MWRQRKIPYSYSKNNILFWYNSQAFLFVLNALKTVLKMQLKYLKFNLEKTIIRSYVPLTPGDIQGTETDTRNTGFKAFI